MTDQDGRLFIRAILEKVFMTELLTLFTNFKTIKSFLCE